MYKHTLCPSETSELETIRNHLCTFNSNNLQSHIVQIDLRVEFRVQTSLNIQFTLQRTNISHLGKRNIIFKVPLKGDTFVPRRVKLFCASSCLGSWDSHPQKTFGTKINRYTIQPLSRDASCLHGITRLPGLHWPLAGTDYQWSPPPKWEPWMVQHSWNQKSTVPSWSFWKVPGQIGGEFRWDQKIQDISSQRETTSLLFAWQNTKTKTPSKTSCFRNI